MADGTIRVSTKIDTSGAKADLEKLQKECEKAAENIEEAGRRMDTALGGKSSKQLATSLERANKELDKTKEKLAEVEAQMEAQAGSWDSMYDKASTEEQRMTIDQMKEMDMEPLNAQWDALNAKAKEQQQTVKDIQNALTAAAEEERRTAEEAEKAKQSQEELSRATKEADKNAKKLRSSFAQAGRAADNAFKGAIHKVTRLALGIIGVRGAFMVLRRASAAYMESNEQLSQSINMVWATLGEMLGPAIEWICNLFVKAIGYINAFIQALTGINFMARANEKALNKQAKATGAAAKAQKSLSTASFDEQNKLQDTSAGGGGGAGGGGSAFQLDPELDPEFLKKIQWVADHFGEILTLAGAIAAAVLTWKIASHFTDSLSTIAGLAVAVGGAVIYVTAFVDALSNGVDWENLTGMIAGAALVVGGLGLAFGTTAAAISLLVVGIGLLTAGIVDWIKTGELSEPAFYAIEAGILAIAAAISLLTGSWIPILIGLLVAIVAWVVQNWDKIKEVCGKIGAWINEKVIVPVCNFFKKLWKDVSGFFKNLWNDIVAIFSKVAAWFNTKVIQPVCNFFKNLWGNVKNGASEVWNSITSIFSKVGGFFTNLWNTIKEKFTKIGSTIGNAVGDAFKTVVNSIISFAENTINKFIRAINAAIDLINKIPGVNIGKLNTLSIPRLARGGIVNNPGRGVPAIIGEAGREAVLPLDKNTEWMDMLAERINGGSDRKAVIQVILSGKKIYEQIVDLQQKKQFATNGGF